MGQAKVNDFDAWVRHRAVQQHDVLWLEKQDMRQLKGSDGSRKGGGQIGLTVAGSKIFLRVFIFPENQTCIVTGKRIGCSEK